MDGALPVEIEYSDYEVTGGTTNGVNDTDIANSISLDPLFIDEVGGNFRLTYNPAGISSPCIDAASTSDIFNDEVDVNENDDTDEPLPWDLDLTGRYRDAFGGGGIVDMGAYEVGAGPIVSIPYPDPPPGW